MEIFPNDIVPYPIPEGVDFGAISDGAFWLKQTYRKPRLAEYSWDRLSVCGLPMDQQGLQALANMCHLRVEAFEYDRFQNDHPRHYLSVVPEQDRS